MFVRNVKCSRKWRCTLPSLRPPGVRALLSPGQVFLLAVIDTNSRTLSARAPSMPLGRRSTRTRWLSVPPEIFSTLSENFGSGGKSEFSWTWTWLESFWSDHLNQFNLEEVMVSESPALGYEGQLIMRQSYSSVVGWKKCTKNVGFFSC